MRRILAIILLISFPAHGKNLLGELGKSKPLQWNLPAIEKTALKNGFKLYLLNDHTLPLFQAKIYLKSGSAYDPQALPGVASLTTNLLIEGGTKQKTPEQVDEWLDSRAIQLSSDVGKETTVITVTALAEQWQEALAMLKEVLLEPRWDEKRFKLAKTKTLEWIRRQEDHPEVVASWTFREKVYGKDHPWGRRPDPKAVEKIKPKDLIAFYQTYFQPNRMLLTVAGDLPGEEIKKWVEKEFKDLPEAEISEPKWEVLPLATKPEQTAVKKDLTQVFMEVGELGLVRHDPDTHAFALLSYILGGDPFVSRLGEDIRTRRGLTYGITTDWNATPVRGTFHISVQTRADAKDEVLKLIRQHLERVVVQGDITQEELDRAKESLTNQFVFWFDSPFQAMAVVANHDLQGYPPDYLQTYTERLNAVTLEDVKRVAKEKIKLDALTTVIVGP